MLYIFINVKKKHKLTKPVKINQVDLKKSPIVLSFLIIIYTNERKGFVLMQKLKAFLCHLQKQCTTIATKDISKNIAQRNLQSHC